MAKNAYGAPLPRMVIVILAGQLILHMVKERVVPHEHTDMVYDSHRKAARRDGEQEAVPDFQIVRAGLHYLEACIRQKRRYQVHACRPEVGPASVVR